MTTLPSLSSRKGQSIRRVWRGGRPLENVLLDFYCSGTCSGPAVPPPSSPAFCMWHAGRSTGRDNCLGTHVLTGLSVCQGRTNWIYPSWSGRRYPIYWIPTHATRTCCARVLHVASRVTSHLPLKWVVKLSPRNNLCLEILGRSFFQRRSCGKRVCLVNKNNNYVGSVVTPLSISISFQLW